MPMADMYPLIAETLERDARVTFTVSGYSMQPMVYHRRDKITLVKPTIPLKKYDVPFYRRENGEFILHRIIKVHKDGSYTCRGDNQWQKEFPVKDNQIIGVVASFNRNGREIPVKKSVGYFLYTRTWGFLHYFKKYYKYIRPLFSKK